MIVYYIERLEINPGDSYAFAQALEQNHLHQNDIVAFINEAAGLEKSDYQPLTILELATKIGSMNFLWTPIYKETLGLLVNMVLQDSKKGLLVRDYPYGAERERIPFPKKLECSLTAILSNDISTPEEKKCRLRELFSSEDYSALRIKEQETLNYWNAGD